MKRFPLHQWRGRKVSFWVINYMSHKREKKELNGWWGTEFLGTSILGRIVWKQTEPISLIFNRPETVKSLLVWDEKEWNICIFFSYLVSFYEKEWGLENLHRCNLKRGTLRSLKIIGGGGGTCPPSSDGPDHIDSMSKFPS